MGGDTPVVDVKQVAEHDVRCANRECELFELKPEADEVTATPGAQPNLCAACSQPLEAYLQDAA